MKLERYPTTEVLRCVPNTGAMRQIDRLPATDLVTRISYELFMLIMDHYTRCRDQQMPPRLAGELQRLHGALGQSGNLAELSTYLEIVLDEMVQAQHLLNNATILHKYGEAQRILKYSLPSS